jgi:hypothetical protein
VLGFKNDKHIIPLRIMVGLAVFMTLNSNCESSKRTTISRLPPLLKLGARKGELNIPVDPLWGQTTNHFAWSGTFNYQLILEVVRISKLCGGMTAKRAAHQPPFSANQYIRLSRVRAQETWRYCTRDRCFRIDCSTVRLFPERMFSSGNLALCA